MSDKYTATAANAATYLIGVAGTANNSKAIVQNNKYAEVVSIGEEPVSYNGTYSWERLSETDMYYVKVIVEFDGNVVAMSPYSYNQGAFLAYSNDKMIVDVNPVSGYEVAEVALKVSQSYYGRIKTEAEKISPNNDGTYSCTLQQRNGTQWYQKSYTNELRIILTEKIEKTEEEEFKANLFKYNQSAINSVSKGINSSKYISIGTVSKGAAGLWNSCRYAGSYQGLAGSTLNNGMITFPNYAAADFFTSKNRDDSRTDYYIVSETEKTS